MRIQEHLEMFGHLLGKSVLLRVYRDKVYCLEYSTCRMLAMTVGVNSLEEMEITLADKIKELQNKASQVRT